MKVSFGKKCSVATLVVSLLMAQIGQADVLSGRFNFSFTSTNEPHLFPTQALTLALTRFERRPLNLSALLHVDHLFPKPKFFLVSSSSSKPFSIREHKTAAIVLVLSDVGLLITAFVVHPLTYSISCWVGVVIVSQAIPSIFRNIYWATFLRKSFLGSELPIPAIVNSQPILIQESMNFDPDFKDWMDSHMLRTVLDWAAYHEVSVEMVRDFPENQNWDQLASANAKERVVQLPWWLFLNVNADFIGARNVMLKRILTNEEARLSQWLILGSRFLGNGRRFATLRNRLQSGSLKRNQASLKMFVDQLQEYPSDNCIQIRIYPGPTENDVAQPRIAIIPEANVQWSIEVQSPDHLRQLWNDKNSSVDMFLPVRVVVHLLQNAQIETTSFGHYFKYEEPQKSVPVAHAPRSVSVLGYSSRPQVRILPLSTIVALQRMAQGGSNVNSPISSFPMVVTQGTPHLTDAQYQLFLIYLEQLDFTAAHTLRQQADGKSVVNSFWQPNMLLIGVYSPGFIINNEDKDTPDAMEYFYFLMGRILSFRQLGNERYENLFSAARNHQHREIWTEIMKDMPWEFRTLGLEQFSYFEEALHFIREEARSAQSCTRLLCDTDKLRGDPGVADAIETHLRCILSYNQFHLALQNDLDARLYEAPKSLPLSDIYALLQDLLLGVKRYQAVAKCFALIQTAMTDSDNFSATNDPDEVWRNIFHFLLGYNENSSLNNWPRELQWKILSLLDAAVNAIPQKSFYHGYYKNKLGIARDTHLLTRFA